MPHNLYITRWIRRYGSFLAKSLKGNARSLQIVIGLFLAGLVCGAFDNPTLSSLVSTIITGLMERFQNLHGAGLLVRIFLNNFSAALMATAAGIIFGIFPLVSAFLNGLVLGAVLFTGDGPVHWNFFLRLLGVVPHGLFELPAFFFALALGIRLGAWPFKKEKRRFFKSLFNEGSDIFFKIILPFLILAAAIETAGIELVR